MLLFQISEERAKEITSLSFTELQSKLQKREFSCIEVLYAFQRVAFTENVQLNFIVQPVLEAEVKILFNICLFLAYSSHVYQKYYNAAKYLFLFHV